MYQNWFMSNAPASEPPSSGTEETFTGDDLFNGITHTSGATLTLSATGGRSPNLAVNGSDYIEFRIKGTLSDLVATLTAGGAAAIKSIVLVVNRHDDLSGGANNNTRVNGIKLRDGAGTLDAYVPTIDETGNTGWTPVTVTSGAIEATDSVSGNASYEMEFTGDDIKETEFTIDAYTAGTSNLFLEVSQVRVTA